jgi:hypothetical protein
MAGFVPRSNERGRWAENAGAGPALVLDQNPMPLRSLDGLNTPYTRAKTDGERQRQLRQEILGQPDSDRTFVERLRRKISSDSYEEVRRSRVGGDQWLNVKARHRDAKLETLDRHPNLRSSMATQLNRKNLSNLQRDMLLRVGTTSAAKDLGRDGYDLLLNMMGGSKALAWDMSNLLEARSFRSADVAGRTRQLAQFMVDRDRTARAELPEHLQDLRQQTLTAAPRAAPPELTPQPPPPTEGQERTYWSPQTFDGILHNRNLDNLAGVPVPAPAVPAETRPVEPVAPQFVQPMAPSRYNWTDAVSPHEDIRAEVERLAQHGLYGVQRTAVSNIASCAGAVALSREVLFKVLGEVASSRDHANIAYSLTANEAFRTSSSEAQARSLAGLNALFVKLEGRPQLLDRIGYSQGSSRSAVFQLAATEAVCGPLAERQLAELIHRVTSSEDSALVTIGHLSDPAFQRLNAVEQADSLLYLMDRLAADARLFAQSSGRRGRFTFQADF